MLLVSRLEKLQTIACCCFLSLVLCVHILDSYLTEIISLILLEMRAKLLSNFSGRLTPEFKRRKYHLVAPGDNMTSCSAPVTRATTPEPQEEDAFLNGDLNGFSESLNIDTASRRSPAQSLGDSASSRHSLPPSLAGSVSSQVSSQQKSLPEPPKTLNVSSRTTVSNSISNGELPTDMGDTSEDEENEVQCFGHEHNGFTSLDDVFYIPIDKMFELLFTDSKLYRDFIAARKTFELVLNEWKEVGNDKVRDISYTLSLNYSIGPKTSPSTEKQTMYGEYSRPGSIYVIDTEVVNGGVPYSDNFYVINRYCMTRISSKKTHLVITSQVKFRNKAWGIVKRLLLKTAREGLDQNFGLLGEFLHKEAEHHVHSPAGQQVKKKRTKRRKISERHSAVKKPQSATDLIHAPASQVSTNKVMTTGPEALHINISVDTLVRCICVVLILLVFFNAVLFYKLWSLEHHASTLHSRAYFKSAPKDSGDWMKLLQKQEQLHESEIERWKDIISSSVTLMDHMKATLKELEDSFSRRSRGQ